MSITGKNLPIDQTLEAAIAPNGMPGRKGIHQAWKSLDPTGRLYFTAEVINRPDAIQPLDIKLSFAGPSVRPRFFSYPLQQVSGTLHYHGDRVDLTNFRGIHGTGSLAIKEGTVFLKHNGSQQVRLPLVQATDLPVDADLLSALPASLRKGLEAIKLQGPVNMVGALVADPPEPGEPPVLWWNGLIQLQKASFSTGLRWSDVTGKMWCCGRYDGTQVESIVGGVELEQARVLGQTLRNVRCRLEVDTDSPETLRLRNLNMDFCGGTIGGEARLDFAPTFQYDVYLKALQIDLEQFGRANDLGEEAELQGAAMGAIHLMGKGNDLGNLRGNGRIDIPQGKLYQLPLLLDLVKAFGLRVPDRTAFEQAHSSFSFEGSKMHFEDLNLVGNAISLRGRGSSDLDGTNLNLDFHADWARMGQLLPPGVTEIPRAISNQLFKIKMRGRIGETRFEKEFIPGVMEPIKRMIGTQE